MLKVEICLDIIIIIIIISKLIYFSDLSAK